MSIVDIERIINSVNASMGFEDLEPSEEAKKIGRDYLEGKITTLEAIEMIKELHRARRVSSEQKTEEKSRQESQ